MAENKHYIIITRQKGELWEAKKHVYFSHALATAALAEIKAHQKVIIPADLAME